MLCNNQKIVVLARHLSGLPVRPLVRGVRLTIHLTDGRRSVQDAIRLIDLLLRCWEDGRARLAHLRRKRHLIVHTACRVITRIRPRHH